MPSYGPPCEFCGEPALYVPIPQPISAVFAESGPDLTPIVVRHACEDHIWLVKQKAIREQDAQRYALDHGRPPDWGETEPELMRNALRSILDKLAPLRPEDAKRIEDMARDKGLL